MELPNGNIVTYKKHARITLLAQSTLDKRYWVDALQTAVYLINKLPTKVLGQRYSYSVLYNKEPNYSELCVFGCSSYPLLRPYQPHKLTFRSKKCVFIGYSTNQKGYRCLDLGTSKVYISRHIIFYEDQFPAKDMDESSNSPQSALPNTPSQVSSFSVLSNILYLSYLNWITHTFITLRMSPIPMVIPHKLL